MIDASQYRNYLPILPFSPGPHMRLLRETVHDLHGQHSEIPLVPYTQVTSLVMAQFRDVPSDIHSEWQ